MNPYLSKGRAMNSETDTTTSFELSPKTVVQTTALVLTTIFVFKVASYVALPPIKKLTARLKEM
jgi:hypothetical protein